MHPSEQPKRILSISVIVASVLIFIMLYQSSRILLMDDTDGSGNESEGITKVTILTSDQIIDQSWGSLAYRGKMEIEEKFPVSTVLHSEVATDEEKKAAVKTALDNGSDLIIGHGREFSHVFTNLAQDSPECIFVTIHGTAKYPNQAVYTFDQGEIDYFVALAAAMKTETNKIGTIDAIDERTNFPQFERGLTYYLPEAEYFYEVVGSRDDGDAAVEIMENFLEEGVDVIYTKGNAYNQYIIEQARKHDIYVIGYLDDQAYMARELVLTSVINDVSQAYIAIMDDHFSEGGIEAGVTVLDESHGVYKLAPFGPMFTQQELDYIESQMDKFNSGELTF